jgi:hypothetical protein
MISDQIEKSFGKLNYGGNLRNKALKDIYIYISLSISISDC